MKLCMEAASLNPPNMFKQEVGIPPHRGKLHIPKQYNGLLKVLITSNGVSPLFHKGSQKGKLVGANNEPWPKAGRCEQM